MITKNYAFVVEGDVFYTMSFPESLPIAARWVAGLSSSPNFVECSLYPEICVGAVRNNNNFYLPTDLSTPLLEIDPGAPQYTFKVAAMVDEEIFGLITFPIEDFASEMIDYLRVGFSSSPIVIECSPETSIDTGWTWDGLNFYPPKEG